MIRSIASIAFVVLALFAHDVHAQPKKVPLPPRDPGKQVKVGPISGVYTIELKEITHSSVTTGNGPTTFYITAQVEVAGVRLTTERGAGTVTAELEGKANREGPIPVHFPTNEPPTLKLSWGPISSKETVQRVRVTVYFHPGGEEPNRDLSTLPQDLGQHDLPGVKPPPPKPPPAITSFAASPNDGYINCGTSATLTWTTKNCDSGCEVTLTAADGPNYSDALLVLPGQLPNGSISVTPVRATLTKYTLNVLSAAGSASASKVVQIYCPKISDPPSGSGLFCFKMTNDASLVSKCYIVAAYDRDEEAAKETAKRGLPGYEAEKISCDGRCP